MIKCSICEKTIERLSLYYEQDGKLYCKSCYKSMRAKCVICGIVIEDSYYETEQGIRCTDCYKASLPKCRVCGKTIEGNYFTWEDDGSYVCSETCAESLFPKCAACGKLIKNGVRYYSFNNNVYCSEDCVNSVRRKCDVCGRVINGSYYKTDQGICCTDCHKASLPKCRVCGNPIEGKSFTWNEDGSFICSETCLESLLPKCAACGNSMKDGYYELEGRKYCSEDCMDTVRPKCKICGKPVREGIRDKKGNLYCSATCREVDLPICKVCGQRVRGGYELEDGSFCCSDSCLETVLPRCYVCGKPVNGGFSDRDNHIFCSEECFEDTLPTCKHCGKKMHKWIVTQDGQTFCNSDCYDSYKDSLPEIDMNRTLSAEELAFLTGLTKDDCRHFMETNHIDGDQALRIIDVYMDAQNRKLEVPVTIASYLKNGDIYIKLAEHLSDYNTMRGGVKGYGGFVFEELHAASEASSGVSIEVLGNNGPADFLVKDASGRVTYVQAKAGYKPGQIDWEKYRGQIIVVDKGNTALAEDARRAGLIVQESEVYKMEADVVARMQQIESDLLGKVNAPITAHVYSAHQAGLASAKFAAQIGVALNVGKNICDLLEGEKNFKDATKDIVCNGVKIAGNAYVGSMAMTLAQSGANYLAGTIVGTAAKGIAVSAMGTVSSAVAGTVVGAAGSTIVGGLGTVAATVSGVSFAPVAAACVAIGFIGRKCKFW